MERGNQIGSIFEIFVISEIVKSYENVGREYHNRLFYYSGWDKTIRNANGQVEQVQSEIDLLIEFNT